jgi:bacterioferritin
MKGHSQIIDILNDVLTAELTAVNQYFVHYKMCANWGYERLAHKFREESFGEMKDADKLIERILYLEGVPNLQRLNKVMVGQTVKEMHELDWALEKAAIDRLNAGIATARQLGDNGTGELLEDILKGEEEHADWIEAQQALIAQVGESHYLAQQIKKES